MDDRKAEMKAFAQQMNLRERLYWILCSREKKEAILHIRRQLDQEMDGHIGGVVHNIGQRIGR